ncbi:hypothetical protein PAMP_013293 [Pampus punctatissimus]
MAMLSLLPPSRALQPRTSPPTSLEVHQSSNPPTLPLRADNTSNLDVSLH